MDQAVPLVVIVVVEEELMKMYMNVKNRVVIEPSCQPLVDVVIFRIIIKEYENIINMAVVNHIVPLTTPIILNIMKEHANGTRTGK